jgi:hypothetical protein
MRRIILFGLLLILSVSSLRAQTAQRWTQVVPNGSVHDGTWPSGRGWNRLIYDSLQQKVLAYLAVATCGDPFSNSIWAYDATANAFTREWWSGGGAAGFPCPDPVVYVIPPNGPGDRHPTQQMAYDTRRDELVIVGGVEDHFKCDGVSQGTCMYNDTWTFSSSSRTWTFDGTNPPSLGRRIEGAAAYDSVHDVVVLFGGTKTGGTDSNTWEFHPSTSTWVKAATSGPPPRLRNTLIYDPSIGKVLCYGGLLGARTVYKDLWAYDAGGHRWTELNPSGPQPPVAKFPPMAHDSKNGLDYLYVHGQTYAYSGVSNSWKLTGVAGGPQSCSDSKACNARTMTYDAATDTLVMTDQSPNDREQVLWTLSHPQ